MSLMNTSASVSAQLSTIRQPGAQTDKDMDQQAFLKLFTTQLQNQNPLEPVKNEAFVAQLAQFSQLEATTKMASSLEAMAGVMQGDRLMTGAALIGKRVASPNGTAELKEGANVTGVLSLPAGASSVQLDVFDQNGSRVFSQNMGRQAPGDVTVRWEGFNNNGQRMPEGRYSVVATVDSFGQITQVPVSTPATVKSISVVNNEIMLELQDGSSVALTKVRRIDS
jgi:flagellar basal-body rod modification protein FlgD